MKQKSTLGKSERDVIRKLQRGNLVVLRGAEPLLVAHSLPQTHVILLTPKDAKEIEDTAEDLSPVGSVSAESRTLWRDALRVNDPQELRDLRKRYVVQILWEDLQKFRPVARLVANRATGEAQRADAKRHLRLATTTGEKALWRSLISSFTLQNKRDAVPILPRCRFCGDPFERRRANSPKDRCEGVNCKRKADRERKYREYHSHPMLRRKKNRGGVAQEETDRRWPHGDEAVNSLNRQSRMNP